MEEMFAIINKNDNGLFWNNLWGWIEADDDATNIDLYTKEETRSFQLPDEGKWHKF